MKVRTKFTLLISLASFIAVVFFSAFVYVRLQNEFYVHMDHELNRIASMVLDNLVPGSTGVSIPEGFALERTEHNLWLKVYSEAGRTLYRSKLAKIADLPPAGTDREYLVMSSIPNKFIDIPSDEAAEVANDGVKMRARLTSRVIGKEKIFVHVAQPVMVLNAEFREVLNELTVGIACTLLLIIISSYLVAGRMLKPLETINNSIRNIRENSLHLRIPFGKSKDELYTLTSALNLMFDRLENSFHRQKTFISDAAHEMKSPLTILMLGHEEMLADNPPKRFGDALEKQLFSMRRLNKLIRDLLNIARLEQQDTLKREPVELDELLNAVLNDYADIIKAKMIDIHLKVEAIAIWADREKLQRLLINLIDNSIKYNLDSGGSIDIHATRRFETVYLYITNRGNPIPEEDIPHIYEQFYRVEKSRAQAFGGTGLGLTIARRIVELHGGSIAAENTVNGTMFTVSLPDIQPAKNSI